MQENEADEDVLTPTMMLHSCASKSNLCCWRIESILPLDPIWLVVEKPLEELRGLGRRSYEMTS